MSGVLVEAVPYSVQCLKMRRCLNVASQQVFNERRWKAAPSEKSLPRALRHLSVFIPIEASEERGPSPLRIERMEKVRLRGKDHGSKTILRRFLRNCLLEY